MKPFYRGAKVTLVAAITQEKVLELMTLDGSLDGASFEGFVDHFLVTNLWQGVVVVMDNLPVHKIASVAPKIEWVPGSFIDLPTLQTLIKHELWWSQLKSFIRKFAPTTASMIDTSL